MFSYPTPASLAAYVAAELNSSCGAAGGAFGERPSSVLTRPANRRASIPLYLSSAAAHAVVDLPSSAQLHRQLAELTAEVAGVVLGAHQPLMDGGVDSIGSVELRCGACGAPTSAARPAELRAKLGCCMPPAVRPSCHSADVPRRNAISERFGVHTPATLIFDHPTLDALTAWLGAELAGKGAVNRVAHPAVAAVVPQTAQRETTAAVVAGVSCAFPGSDGLAALWPQVAAGGDVQAALPLCKWDVDAMYSPDLSAAAGGAQLSYARFAGTLDGSDGDVRLPWFDADAFRLPRAEAAAMDPQVRLLLEHTGAAVADAQGRTPQQGPLVSGSDGTGAYVGCMWATEYVELLPRLGALDTAANVTTGNTFPFMVGRLSFTFGFQGPCVSTDTACSSSLVSAHLAASGLERGECVAAVAAGANALLSSRTMVKISALQVGRARSGHDPPLTAAWCSSLSRPLPSPTCRLCRRSAAARRLRRAQTATVGARALQSWC